MKNPHGLHVVPLKHHWMEWGYAIVDANGRVVSKGWAGPYGGPLVSKGSAKRAGAQALKALLKNQKRVERSLKKRH